MTSVPTNQKNEKVILKDVSFTHAEIAQVVNDFYTNVATDPLLQKPFSTVKDWPHHIERMTHFWWIKFGGTPYLPGFYDPVSKHYLAGFNSEFLARWLDLFERSLKKNLHSQQAQLWLIIASRIGEALTFKNEMYRITKVP
jgi:hemoglobin